MPEGPQGRIFINYRRSDSQGDAGRLYDRLEQEFGGGRLFMDVDTIPPGADFTAVLENAVAGCDVFLAIIGQTWLDTPDPGGGRRLDNPKDFVRIEIASALRLGKHVIPVLVNGARMPPADSLPEPLKPLWRRNAVRLTHERFKADAQGLVHGVRAALAEAQRARAALAQKEMRWRREQREAAPAVQENMPGAARHPEGADGLRAANTEAERHAAERMARPSESVFQAGFHETARSGGKPFIRLPLWRIAAVAAVLFVAGWLVKITVFAPGNGNIPGAGSAGPRQPEGTASISPDARPAGVFALEPVAVAVNGPMTGTYATFGNQLTAGASAWVADINASGGLLGRPVKLNIGDDACEPKQALALANKTVELGVKFVAGHFCSSSSIPSSSVYAPGNVIQISPASSNPAFTLSRPGAGIFRVAGRDDQQGKIAGNYIVERFAHLNIAILHDGSSYGKMLTSGVKGAMNSAGKKETFSGTVNPGMKDYSAIVSQLKQFDIDLVYYGGYHTEAGLIVRQMRASGLKSVLIGGDALVTKDYWNITGDGGEGTLMTFTSDPRLVPSTSGLVRRFRSRNVEPEGYVLYTYAAFQVWEQAVKKAATFDHAKVVEHINGMDFETVIGRFRFDRNGDLSLPGYSIYKWTKGHYEQL